MNEARGRGRPKKEGGAKNAPLNMRTTPWLRERIEESAELFGTSLSSEVERRLTSSFLFDQATGGPHIAWFTHMLGATIHSVEETTGARWVDDAPTFAAVEAAIARLLDWKRPVANVLAPSLDTIHGALDEAEARQKELRDYVIEQGIEETLGGLSALTAEQAREYFRLREVSEQYAKAAIELGRLGLPYVTAASTGESEAELKIALTGPKER